MKQTIVLAEDDPQIARLTTFKLEKEGYTVFWEKNGSDAFDRIRETRPNIILLDVMMPVLDGFQVLEKLKSDEELQDIPVIMLTAKGQERDREKGFETGATDFFVKPFRPAELVQRIEKILDSNS